MLTDMSLSIISSFALGNIEDNQLEALKVEAEDIFTYRYNLHGFLYSKNIHEDMFPFIEIYNKIQNWEFDKVMTLYIPDYDFTNTILQNTKEFIENNY